LPASFIIRDIELNDRARWEPLWRAYSRPIPEEVTEMTWRRFFDGLEPVHALVAEEGEAMIGFVHYLFHRSTAQLGSVCYLQDMFTVEIARGRGVGRAMIEAVGVRAKAGGASRVYWNTGETNARHAPSTTRSRHSPNSSSIARTCERWSEPALRRGSAEAELKGVARPAARDR
jgi:GNAT superfamily N-acetyltransferase